jgi:transmembrane protein EpsG
MLLVYALIILIPPAVIFKKYSYSLGISFFIFIAVGPYYDSFNITRQVMAVSILFLGFKYLVNRNFIKFASIVMLAMLFHVTALFMFFMYFIMVFKTSKYNFFMIIAGYSLVYIFIDLIGLIGMKYVYTGYDLNSYGIDGGSLNKLWMPFFILAIVLTLYSVASNKNYGSENFDHYTRILINSVLHYLCICILATEFKLFERFAYYLLPYIALSVPYALSLIKNKDSRILICCGFFSVLLVYNFYTMSGTPYDPYFTIFAEAGG